MSKDSGRQETTDAVAAQVGTLSDMQLQPLVAKKKLDVGLLMVMI